jgi:hypothetical protein
MRSWKDLSNAMSGNYIRTGKDLYNAIDKWERGESNKANNESNKKKKVKSAKKKKVKSANVRATKGHKER